MGKASIIADRGPSVRTSEPDGFRWQEAMKSAIRDPAELCRRVGISTDLASYAAARDFPVFAPLGYIERMQWGDPKDPLLQQVLPMAEETQATDGYSIDPVGDLSATLTPGLLHKYQGRVLMITTGACAVHCRYCFRRHFPYTESPRSLAAWEPAIEQIAMDSTISEVILSGGDPLTLVDEQLARLTQRLAEIPHLRRLRVHTRLPVIIPERVTDELVAWLRGTRLTPIMVVHANHAAELDQAVASAVAKLVDAGIPLLNQTVLLRGINDDVESLAELSERLLDLRVMPYYLHQLDKVHGAAHFEIPIATGKQLIEKLRARLPGYAVPRYVVEVAGDASKRPID